MLNKDLQIVIVWFLLTSLLITQKRMNSRKEWDSSKQ